MNNFTERTMFKWVAYILSDINVLRETEKNESNQIIHY